MSDDVGRRSQQRLAGQPGCVDGCLHRRCNVHAKLEPLHCGDLGVGHELQEKNAVVRIENEMPLAAARQQPRSSSSSSSSRLLAVWWTPGTVRAGTGARASWGSQRKHPATLRCHSALAPAWSPTAVRRRCSHLLPQGWTRAETTAASILMAAGLGGDFLRTRRLSTSAVHGAS